ncbi:MAG: hypothetical protein ACE5OZ_20465 [Candidatus Heimdallarchaeota archaeon]
MRDTAFRFLGFAIILQIAVFLPITHGFSSNNFSVTEKSRVSWSQAWETSLSLTEMPALIFQGIDNSVHLSLETQDNILLQIIELNDASDEFSAYLGAEGKDPSGKLVNPRIAFWDFLIPLLFSLKFNLTNEAEAAGFEFVSSDTDLCFFKSEKDNATHLFELEVTYFRENHLLAQLNATWFEKTAVGTPVLRFSLADPVVNERFAEVAEPIEWLASAILILIGLAIVFVTRFRD